MANLLQETIECIDGSGHTPNDVIFIGSERTGHSCTWVEFTQLADVEYDDGFGAQKVASDLVVVFSDGTKMWRHEYDGSECWHYSRPFVMPLKRKPIKSLIVGEDQIGWCSLDDINKR